MKTFVASLAAQYARATTTLATFWKVTRVDGTSVGITDADQDFTADGVTFYAAGGLAMSSADSTSEFEGNTIDVAAFMGPEAEAELQSGDWDDAEIVIGEYNWADPPTALNGTTVNILRRGWLGEVQRRPQQLQAEILGLVQRLRTRLGAVYSATCRYRFGDSFCTKDLTALTYLGTLTGVGNDPHLHGRDTDLQVANNVFNFGEIKFLTGRNAGRQTDIRLWSNHQFTLNRPLPFPMETGDQYRAIAGCDKRLPTCIAYDNVANFGGEPHVPGVDKLHSNDIQAAPQPPRPEPPDGNPDNDSGGGSSEDSGDGGTDEGGEGG
jgi:uncharacterized phage protein (TIGR02218 family)